MLGLIDWDSVVSDLVYLQHNNKMLVSLITANVSAIKILATLICIYINDYKKPNKIFIICVVLCSINSLIIGTTYNLGWLDYGKSTSFDSDNGSYVCSV